jgi:hypothetical protein
VHLVRDSRAVAYSWRQPTVRKELDGNATFSQYGYLESSARWAISNVIAEYSQRRTLRYLRVRYEDLAGEPEQVLATAAAFLGVTPRAADDPAPTEHTLRGNPAKFSPNQPVRLDTRWTTEMARPAKALVTASTYPLLRHYGYR